jgi:S1-C subfamily serine protease
MRSFPYVGPGLVVLVSAAAALVAAPFAIRRASDAQASADIVLAARVLDGEVAAAATPPKRGAISPASTGVEVDAPILEQINRAHRAIAKLVEPSVVHVSTLTTMRRRSFTAPYASSGSGWIWDEEGHIVTNAHVVESSDRVQVQLFDGELREAEVVGLDLRSDVAVLKVASGGLHPALRGDSIALEQGDMVFAFGSPFDFRFSMSSGIVSGLQRSAGLADIDYENFIQTDAAINPGNSGGPLTDVRGRVIGMNTAIATGRGNSVGQGQFAGIGLAIPMSMIESIVTQIIESGEVRKGFLGVGLMSLDEARAASRSSPLLAAIASGFKGEGAVVREVNQDSPAAEAGFEFGDVIVAIDGQKVAGNSAVPAIISSKRPGAEVEFEVWRADDDGGGGTVQKLVARLAELDSAARLAPYLPAALRAAGIQEFSTSTDARAKRLNVPFRRGILLERIARDSDLAERIPEGSTIVAVFDQPVGSIDEFYTRVNRAVASMGRVPGFQLPLRVVLPDGTTAQVVVPVR